jgi:hypothetical protein
MKMTKQVVVPLVAILLFASFAVAGAGILVSNTLHSSNTVTAVPATVEFHTGNTYSSGILVEDVAYTMDLDVSTSTDIADAQLVIKISGTGIALANVTLYRNTTELQTGVLTTDLITYTMNLGDVLASTPQVVDLDITFNMSGSYDLDIEANGWTA